MRKRVGSNGARAARGEGGPREDKPQRTTRAPSLPDRMQLGALTCVCLGSKLAMPLIHTTKTGPRDDHALSPAPPRRRHRAGGDGRGRADRRFFNKKGKAQFKTETALCGGASIDKHGVPLTSEALAKAEAADAIVFGAVGGPKWDKVAYAIRPEAGLLRLRKDLDLFANLRPAICYAALAEASSLPARARRGPRHPDPARADGRHLFRRAQGDRHAGERREARRRHHRLHHARDRAHRPRRLRPRPQAQEQGALGRQAQRHEDGGAVARGRHRHARARGQGRGAAAYPGRCLRHAAGAQPQAVRRHRHRQPVRRHAVRRGRHADGLIGMLPSASLGAPDAKTGARKALYEPVHGSAPDIAGKGLANPIAAIASYGMALRYSYGLTKEADLIDKAIAGTLAAGLPHRRHHAAQHAQGRHVGDGQGDPRGNREACGLSWKHLARRERHPRAGACEEIPPPGGEL